MESEKQQVNGVSFFQMPLHYPRYTMKDYLNIPEWKLDRLLAEYGLSAAATLQTCLPFVFIASEHAFHSESPILPWELLLLDPSHRDWQTAATPLLA
ncbi:Regulator of chromosome condensation repeat-containing protein isoform 1 [Hibiscus syriacus]|uniref:Regulator of chromosome condensation repeat-containing protein isoform 1 n=1 Tax=Hibiscus syriacus TaxID=106335 RepID=A0A6A3B883_HIBSY|nr:Regulator of chromosome condensation repeat-containing protein isoform 1 [Hibiscus syriacus]